MGSPLKVFAIKSHKGGGISPLSRRTGKERENIMRKDVRNVYNGLFMGHRHYS